MKQPDSIIVNRIGIPASEGSGISLSIARLDLLHPVVSGNKIFKLHYFLNAPGAVNHNLVITAGGAYSNHLVATAYACRERGIASIGVVRGEKNGNPNQTLQDCMAYGMKLHFVSRSEFSSLREEDASGKLADEFGPHLFIPEGGFHPSGAAGASLIAGLLKDIPFTHLCMPAGTFTTIAGVSASPLSSGKKIIGFPALKGMKDIMERFSTLKVPYDPAAISIKEGYDFGGYAAISPQLLEFMNSFYRDHGIPLDFVYTGKMMFGVTDMIRKGEFPVGSEILCLHTGGLQGNRSLPAGALEFN